MLHFVYRLLQVARSGAPIVLEQFSFSGFVGIIIPDSFDLSHGACWILLLVLPDKEHRLEDVNWVDLKLLKALILFAALLPKLSQVDAVWIESGREQIERGQVSPAFV